MCLFFEITRVPLFSAEIVLHLKLQHADLLFTPSDPYVYGSEGVAYIYGYGQYNGFPLWKKRVLRGTHILLPLVCPRSAVGTKGNCGTNYEQKGGFNQYLV